MFDDLPSLIWLPRRSSAIDRWPCYRPDWSGERRRSRHSHRPSRPYPGGHSAVDNRDNGFWSHAGRSRVAASWDAMFRIAEALRPG
jgi:hypothetical protein